MKWRILAIGFYFVGEDEAERVPHADVYGCARTSRLLYLFDDGSASLLVGEHCGEFTGPRLTLPARKLRALRHDGGVALGAGGDHSDFHLQEIADEAQVIHRGLGQSRVVLHTVSRLAPARQRFVFRRHALVFFGERRHFAELRAFVFVADADLNLALRVENIEFGDDQRIDAVDHFGVAQHLEIKPATAPRASGDRAKLLAALADF